MCCLGQIIDNRPSGRYTARVSAISYASTRRRTPTALAREESDARRPSSVSVETWAFLAHHVERTFRRRSTRESLRRAVRRLTAEMAVQGIDEARVSDALARAVTEHPACARFDCMMLATGERYSRGLIATMQGWAQRGGQG
jgi:hypothetical protein